jgi:hypothetical protein
LHTSKAGRVSCEKTTFVVVFKFPRDDSRARICKRLWSPGIDSKELISPAYVACRAGTTNRVVVPARQAENRFLGSLKGLQIRAQPPGPYGNLVWEKLYDIRGVRKLSVLIKIGSEQFLYTIAVALKIVYTNSPLSTLRKVGSSAHRFYGESLTPRIVVTVVAF